MSVDFPDPDAPMIAMYSPVSTESVIPARAATSTCPVR